MSRTVSDGTTTSAVANPRRTIRGGGLPVYGIADLDIAAARPEPRDEAAIDAWNAANERARNAYEGVKERAAVPPARSRAGRSQPRGGG